MVKALQKGKLGSRPWPRRIWPGFRGLAALFLLILGLLGGSACHKEAPKSDVLAQINGEILTGEEFSRLLRARFGVTDKEAFEKVRKSPAYADLRSRFFEETIEEYILAQEARARGIEIPRTLLERHAADVRGHYSAEDFQKHLDAIGLSGADWLEHEERRLAARLLLQSEAYQTSPAPEADVERYYKEHADEFQVPEKLRLAQIVVTKEVEALQIFKSLEQNRGENFAEMARRHSVAPEAIEGGLMGEFEVGSLPQAFEPVFALSPGQFTKVLASEYGFHIVKVLERRPARVLPLKEVKMRIQAKLKQATEDRILAAFRKGLREKAKIVRNETQLQAL